MSDTLDRILTVPGNRPVFDALAGLLRQERVIAFVGAGASAGLYPLWGKFIELLADHAVAEGKATEQDRARWRSDTSASPQQRVSVIARKLGEERYFSFLKATFGPRSGADGKRFTPTHAALLMLPFRGYITTNYDPALDFARTEIRRGCHTTSMPTWKDDEEVYNWLTGDVFTAPEACPILWLHGIWQQPQTIILNSSEYARAYRPGLCRRTLDRFWIQDHLVFIGFGFNDPQFTYMVSEMLRDIAGANAAPRHIAVLGLRPNIAGAYPDFDAVDEHRTVMEADYHVRPLFYRVKLLAEIDEDHSELFALLHALADGGTSQLAISSPPSPSSGPTQAPAALGPLCSHWVHQSTNDMSFVGRVDEISRLDRWVKDDVVRVIGVCGVGGAGKTSLVGHWLQNTDGWRSRPFGGLFAWSFYQNRDARLFLRELLLWARETFGTPRPTDRTDLIGASLALLRHHPLVVVLDGLEVQQEGPDNARHGAFLDGALREFLTEMCQLDHRSLAVLTSRFVFADLERFLGRAMHQLELLGLNAEQGAALLAELGVLGSHTERAEVSRRLEGHPLGLRVLAGALPESERGEPQRFLDHAFQTGAVRAGSPLRDKLEHVLNFYQKKLSPMQVRLLSVVALFRSPVPDETILRLTHGLYRRHGEPPISDDQTLSTDLRKLHARGILTREPIDGGHGNACHPILRDHFRSVLLGTSTDTARRAADLLQGQPSSGKPRSVREIEPVLLAIELLLDAGDFKAADELYRDRLGNGTVLNSIPALAEGFACAFGFARDEIRRRMCSAQLGDDRLAYYLNEIVIFASGCGDYNLASQFSADHVALCRRLNARLELCIGLMNQAHHLIFVGQLSEASLVMNEALGLAAQVHERMWTCIGHAYRAWTLALRGDPRSAAIDYAFSSQFAALHHLNLGKFDAHVTIHGSEVLLRSGHPRMAASRVATSLQLAGDSEWNDDTARCHWMLAWCALAEGRLDDAETECRRAEPVLQRGQILFWLARLHVTAGWVALARRNAGGALRRAAEALNLAAPRGMRLIHADALVLRGQARLLEGKPDNANRAIDDADEALRLARDCGYVWAEHDALSLQAEALRTVAATHEANAERAASERARDAASRARAGATSLAAKLCVSLTDLAAVDVTAAAWLRDQENNKTSNGG